MLRVLLSAIFIVAAVLPAALSAQTSYTSGVIASESARGTFARNMARDLSQGSSSEEQKFFDTFMQARVAAEGLVDRVGLTKGDVGMAYGVYFMTMWELAHDKTLPEAAELKVVQYWTTHLDEVGLNSAQLGPNKDALYDWLFHAPVILVTLKEAAKQAGDEELLAALKQNAAQMFVFLTKYPASFIKISERGAISFDEAALKTFLETGDEDEVRQFLSSSKTPDEIDAFLKNRGGASGSKAQSESDYDRHVRDTYNSILMNNTTMSLSTALY